MPFRLHSKNLFLTYPQCSASKAQLLDFLQQKFSNNLVYAIIGQEQHADGNKHLHATITLANKVDYRSPTCLDFSVGLTRYHGNYQGARDVAATITYCTKDDAEPLSYGERPEPKGAKRKWAAALGAESINSFMDAVADADPKSFVIFNDKIESFARKKFKAPASVYTDPFPDSWLPNTQMDSWALDNIVNWVPSQAIRPKSLILVGDSRLGKTAWARKHGEHVYFNGTWNMAKLDAIGSNTKYAVWDDLFNWESFNYKQWLGGQWEFDVTGKYRAPRTISDWGRPSIVCCNALPSHLDNQWVKDNCLIVYVRFPLFQ